MARRAWVFALACAFGARVGRCDEALTLEMRTSDRRAIERDTYLYTSVDIPPGAFHVRRFEPVATQDVVHHMLLYGCALMALMSRLLKLVVRLVISNRCLF